MSETAIKKLLNGKTALPVMPTVVSRLLEFQRNGCEELDELTEIIGLDVGIAATILRYANSPLYRIGAPVETLDRAVLNMGYKAIADIALSLSLVKNLNAQTIHCLDGNLFWRRSLIAATAARALGAVQREKSLEELFLAGLLQDVGMLALDLVKSESYGEVARFQTDHRRLIEAEQSLFGFDHARFGAALLTKWGLHRRTVSAVLSSHNDFGDSVDSFGACVAAAGDIADLFISGGADGAYQRIEAMLYRYFSVRAPQVQQLLVNINTALEDVAGLFGSVLRSTGELSIALPELFPGGEQAVMSATLEVDAQQELNEIRGKQLLEEDLELEGVMSRRAFENSLKNSFKMLRNPLISVVFLSLDNLYALADEHGAKVAELVLRAVSRKLSEQIRVEDFMTRYGNCFSIILMDTGVIEALALTEHIVDIFADTSYPVANGEKVSLDMRAGLAGNTEALRYDSEQHLLEAAASALYRARRAGSFAIVHESPETSLAAAFRRDQAYRV